MCSTMATSSHSPRRDRKGADPDILIVEPFYCGSHKQLVDCLMRDEVIGPRVHLVTMSGKKWHWRARVSALHLFSAIPVNHNFKVLFSSSVLNLAELVALRNDLAGLHKVLYVHENQLQYPVQKQKERDFQYGYNQILSCLVADSVLFNSAFNMESFLASVNPFLKLMPDYRPKGLADILRPKCSVVYFPMQYPVHLHFQGKHQNHPSAGTTTKMQTSPVNYCHSSKNLKHNNQLPKCSSAEDKQVQHTERNHIADTFNIRTSRCSDSSSSNLMCCSPDFEMHTPSDTRTELHPQAKVGRLDCKLAAAMVQQDGGKAVQTREQDGDKFTDSKYHAHEHVQSSSEACCFQRTSPASEQKVKHAADYSVDFLIDTHRPVSEKQCAGVHGHGKPSNCVVSSQVGCVLNKEKGGCLHIVWPHRWEHDKDPQSFFQTLFRLQEDNQQFLVSVLGETFTDVPDIFAEAEQRLKGHVFSWGYQADKAAYFRILQQADVVVSTSKHEFFGVAMLEAVYLGCYPLCPRSLVYPELYPEECLYSTQNQLYKRLRAFCRQPHLLRQNTLQMDLDKFSWDTLRPVYLSKLQINS